MRSVDEVVPPLVVHCQQLSDTVVNCAVVSEAARWLELVQYELSPWYEAGRRYGTTEVIRQCTKHEAPLNLF